ncbi:MAG TPA: DUF2851 family protein [Chitinophagaceae bacterium]
MTERLLQFIWQFQYFNKNELLTTNGEPVQIIHPGTLNTHQGPDFLNAKVIIGNTTWAGSVELHIQSSQWRMHGHQHDKNYNNVMLHVVCEDDQPQNKIAVPVIELKQRISNILLSKYAELMNNNSFIPCQNSIQLVNQLTWHGWMDRLLAERLLRKSQTVISFLQQTNNNWEEAFWWLLARNFGMPVNADAFEQMARTIPVKLLAKHKNQLHQLEALLLGQAGLLQHDFEEDYPIMLKKEYIFLQKKYKLQPIHITPLFLRMRPGNFPTIRLAQLAMLVQNSSHLFSKIKEAGGIDEIKQWLNVTANDYWHYHYRLDESSGFKKKNIGVAMINNIIINTVVPVLFAYGEFHSELHFKDKALKWLEDISAEKNTITTGFVNLGKENKNAYDSQAMIQLKNEYCNKKRCLECSVGNAIIRSV